MKNGITPDPEQTLAIMLLHGTYQQQCEACKIIGLPLPGKNGFVSEELTLKRQTIPQEIYRLSAAISKLHHDLKIAYGKKGDPPTTVRSQISDLQKKLYRLTLP
jgi:hypothetical protein